MAVQAEDAWGGRGVDADAGLLERPAFCRFRVGGRGRGRDIVDGEIDRGVDEFGGEAAAAVRGIGPQGGHVPFGFEGVGEGGVRGVGEGHVVGVFGERAEEGDVAEPGNRIHSIIVSVVIIMGMVVGRGRGRRRGRGGGVQGQDEHVEIGPGEVLGPLGGRAGGFLREGGGEGAWGEGVGAQAEGGEGAD